MTAFLLFIAFLFGFGFIVGLTRSSTLGVIAFILISVIIIGNWIALGFFQAVGAFLCTVIPFLIGMGLTDYDRPDSGSGSSSSKRSSSSSDIPDYWNWDQIYDRLSGEVDVIGPITTMEKAAEQFYKDYNRTKRMFAELDGLQKVADMDRTYIFTFFQDMETVINNGSVTFDNRGGGEFYIRYNRNGISRSYHHWPYRKEPVYDQLMWRGEIVNNGSWLRYGLNNEENIQYWRVCDGITRTGIDALRGEVEDKRIN